MAAKKTVEKFNKDVEKTILKELGGTVKRTDEWRKQFLINTKAGELMVTLHAPEKTEIFSIFCCFEEPKKAAQIVHEHNLNTYSGKFNFHNSDKDMCLQLFVGNVKAII